MWDEVEQIIFSSMGVLGFSFFFHVSLKRIPFTVAGGIITAVAELLLLKSQMNLYICCLVASAVSDLYSEVLARILKAPASIFLLPSITTLLPGGSLYYTMEAVIKGNHERMYIYGSETLQISLGIATGILFTSHLFYRCSEMISYTKSL